MGDCRSISSLTNEKKVSLYWQKMASILLTENIIEDIDLERPCNNDQKVVMLGENVLSKRHMEEKICSGLDPPRFLGLDTLTGSGKVSGHPSRSGGGCQMRLLPICTFCVYCILEF